MFLSVFKLNSFPVPEPCISNGKVVFSTPIPTFPFINVFPVDEFIDINALSEASSNIQPFILLFGILNLVA